MKLKMIIVFGGESVEHEISILSAMQVLHALDPTKYEIIPVYIAKDGFMYQDDCLFDLASYQDLDALTKRLKSVSIVRLEQKFYIIPTKQRLFSSPKEFDIAFPVLHGTYGEDGTFQGYLRTLRIPYVGCSVLGGALGQDKVIMKQLLQEEGLPIVPWFFYTSSQELNQAFLDKAQRLGYPLIVKPANLGSSIGIHYADDKTSLLHAMQEAFRYDAKVVVEKAIQNLCEINCAVLGDEEQMRVSTLEEVFKQDAILSYDDKYIGNSKTKGMANTARIIPANISDMAEEEIKEYALRTFRVLQARGVSRIDFLIDKDSGMIYVNEINTIPGSLSYYLWAASGLDFPDLLDELIALAIKQDRLEQKRVYRYTTNILKDYQAGGSKHSK